MRNRGGFNLLLHVSAIVVAATTGCLCKIGVMDVALLRPAVVYDLHVEVWHVLAAEIVSYAKSSRSSGSDDHPCMSSKA